MSDVRLTDFGREAVNAAMSGLTKIRFNCLKTGSSALIIGRMERDPATGRFKAYRDLETIEQTANISSIKYDETTTTVVVSGTFSNENLAKAYDIVEVGLYATCEGEYTETTPRLFAYKVFFEPLDHMPLPTDLPTSFTYDFNSTVSDESVVNLIIEPGTYASAADVQNLTNLVHTNEPQSISIRCNNTVETTEKTGYNYMQEISLQGITDKYWVGGQISAGTYVGTCAVESLTDKIRLWFDTKPATSVDVIVTYFKTY